LEKKKIPMELKPKIYQRDGIYRVKRVAPRSVPAEFMLKVMEANTEAGMFCVERNYVGTESGKEQEETK
jgi:hypothetical protein